MNVQPTANMNNGNAACGNDNDSANNLFKSISRQGSISIDIANDEWVENEIPDSPQQDFTHPRVPSRRSSKFFHRSSRTSSYLGESGRASLKNSLTRATWEHSASAMDISYDASLLERIVDDIGRHAYGIIGIEIWMMDDNGMTLSQPEGGFWIDNVYLRSYENNSHLRRLRHSDAEPVVPGQGIAGYLFSESNETGSKHHASQGVNAVGKPKLPLWQHLQDIVDDEDKTYDERTNKLLQAGFQKALPIGFHYETLRGVVLFYARGSANENDIFGPLQQIHLFGGVDMIESTLWMQNTRRAVALENRKKAHDAQQRLSTSFFKFRVALAFRNGISSAQPSPPKKSLKRSRNAFRSLPLSGYFSKESQSKNKENNPINHDNLSSSNGGNRKSDTARRVETWANKCKGAGRKPPPGKRPKELVFVFFCVLVQLLIVTGLDDLIRSLLGEKYGFQRGAFGSNSTSYFSLPAAPASQPRAFILGHTMCCSISIVLRYFIGMIPAKYRASLGGALGTTAMAAFGLSTPSASALSATFSYDKDLGWIHVGLLLVQNIVMVLIGTFLNNWSAKRQYPHTWTFIVWPEKVVAFATKFKSFAESLTHNLQCQRSRKSGISKNMSSCKQPR